MLKSREQNWLINGSAFVSAASLMRLRLRLWAFMLTRDTERRAYYVVSYCWYGGREKFLQTTLHQKLCRLRQGSTPMQLCCLSIGTMVAAPACACDCASAPLRLPQACTETLITKQQAGWRPDRQRFSAKANSHIHELIVEFVRDPSCLDLCRCSRNGRSTKVLHQL